MKKRTMLKSLMAMALVCASVAFAAEVTTVKGNEKSKTYHKPECRFYSSKGSTVEFKSEVEAKQAGYTACKQCGAVKAEKAPEKKPAKKAETAE
jgi:methylphosphotriester-DNA--protein-cysteine methyltransferase